MSHVTLKAAKAHLRVTHRDEDRLIQGCIDAAESYAASFMGRTSIAGLQACPWLVSSNCSAAECGEPSPPPSDEVPPAVTQAILLLVGDFYSLREASSAQPVNANPAVRALLHMHRVGLGV